MLDWTVPKTAAKQCDMCQVKNRQVQAFTLVHTVYAGEKRKTRSAGGIWLCPACWRATGGMRRRPGSPRPELSATVFEAAAAARAARAAKAKLGKP